MKRLLITMTVSILLSMPVLATEDENPCANQPQDEKCQTQIQDETKYRHDHRDQKGIPHAETQNSKDQENTSDGMKKMKMHDHKEVHK